MSRDKDTAMKVYDKSIRSAEKKMQYGGFESSWWDPQVQGMRVYAYFRAFFPDYFTDFKGNTAANRLTRTDFFHEHTGGV